MSTLVRTGITLQATRPVVSLGTPGLAAHNTLSGRSTAAAHPTSAITGLDAALAARQPLDAELTALAGLTTTADTLAYWTGSATAALTALTSFGRSLIGAADGPAAKVLLSLGLLASSVTGQTATFAGALTAPRSYTLPDENGTLALLGRAQSWGALQTFTAGLTVSAGTTALQAVTCTTLTASSLTSGRVPFAGTAGLLGDDQGFTYTGGANPTLSFGSDATPASGATSQIILNGANNSTRRITIRTGGSARWRWEYSGDETGSNAGCNLNWYACTDAGALIDAPISVTRAAGGAITFARPLSAAGITCTTLTASGAFTATTVLGRGNAQLFIQSRNAANNATLDVLYTDSTDRVVIGGGGRPIVATGGITCTTLTASGAVTIASATEGKLLLGPNAAGGYADIQLRGNGATTNWLIGTQYNVGGALEFTPSTAMGGSTFSTPLLTLTTSGAALGAAALLGSERFRVAGGTMGTPGATDVLLAGGAISCGDTSATSIQTAGGITTGGNVIFNGTVRSKSNNTAGTGFALAACTIGYDGTATLGWIQPGNATVAAGLQICPVGGVVDIGSASGACAIKCTTASTSTATGALTVAGGVGVAGAVVGGTYMEAAKCRMTAEGGFAILMTADEAIAVGNVCASIQGGTANRVKKCPISGNENDMPIGVAYTTAAGAGSTFWMVVSGRVGVLPDAGVTAAQGYIITTSSTTAGLVAQAAMAPAATTHFKEIGHFLTTGSGNGAITDAIVHFN